MKKFRIALSLIMLLIGSQAIAIGLPNNAYIERHSPHAKSLHSVNGSAQKYTLISEAKSTYAAEEESTLNSKSDLHEFSKAIVDKIVSFISMIVLSLSTFGNSVADELHMVHHWIVADFPPQT